jgi:ribosomal RNA-processing protein 8
VFELVAIGDAQLAKAVKNKVFSLDLVACDDSVIACNMAHVSSLSAPGFLNFLESAPEQHDQVGWTLRVMQSLCCLYQTPLETASIDVAVFCLSLMGVDYSSFLKEAYRVLKIRFCLTMVCTAVV